MYKPIVEKDNQAICALLKYIKTLYVIIGVVVFTLGILIMPFLGNFIHGDYPEDINLYILFAMYLFNMVFGYFFYGYTTSIFLANQRNDIISIVSLIINIAQYILQIIVLYFTKNYTLYIMIYALIVIPQNLLYRYLAKKEYPMYKCEGDVTKESKKRIKTEVTSLLGHKIGAVVLVSIDSVLISTFLGLKELAIYGNYYYIFSSVIGLTTILSQSLLSGVGTKLISSTKEDAYILYKQLNFAWIWIVTICACFLYGLFNPFITMIFGEKYCYNAYIVFLIVLYYYFWQFRNMGLTFKDAAGLWSKDWFKPYLGMGLNLVGSIILLKIIGSVVAVLIPTVFVMLFIYFPIETVVIHKNIFRVSFRSYVIKTLVFVCVSIFCIVLTYFACSLIKIKNDMLLFVLDFLICLLVPNFVLLCIYHKSKEFKQLLCYIKRSDR